MTLADVSLDDKYGLTEGRAFMTGIQALVRLPMEQRRRDAAAGYDTAGFISGYRGSPLGGYDQQLRGAQALLEAHQVRFSPGVNEDLAATAVWGSQQAQLAGEGRHDGVFAIWYGKGPGVDRSGDALRHANLAGTAALGGVLALLGDDHTCESSTTSHQSEYAMVDAMIPVLNPAGVQEILDYGLYGIALSRYSGCWAALKCVHDTVESSSSVLLDASRARCVTPEDFLLPEGGLNIRWPDTPQRQEARLHEHKLEAARAFCRANVLDRRLFGGEGARIGVITTGKSYLDVRQALQSLEIDTRLAERLGLRLYKVAMSWPLEPRGVRDFCAGLEQVIVVEEKRGLIESQLKELMYGEADAPRVIGKRDERGEILFHSAGRLESDRIAEAIGARLAARTPGTGLEERIAELRRRTGSANRRVAPLVRVPYFCAGCPHNTSTRVPAGSRALAGIGCHYMAQWMDRDTERYTQMGAEGASWIGEAPFSRRKHVFQNIGDGTYFHSGLLAIRAAVASGANITFKILYNDAVAMTGGQAVDGPLDVEMITRQVHAEGVKRVVVVSEAPRRFRSVRELAPGTRVHHRDALDEVQRDLRRVAGTSVIVYDQTCAAEKRRRRKRGTYPDPAVRVFINEAVCEGCGDCGVQSNCVAIVPVETEFGRKRAIDQSACNKDYSCLKGFCPSFVSIHGGRLRRPTAFDDADGAGHQTDDGRASDWVLENPDLPSLDRPYGIVITGVGGTGVITIGALIGMAAHLEGKGCSILDMTGLAQKGGAVMSHVYIAAHPEAITSTRIAMGDARALLGCDAVVAAAPEVLATLRPGVSRVILNTHASMPGEFTRDADLQYPGAALARAVRQAAGDTAVDALDATRLAGALLGDAIATNLFLLGVAWQQGAVPVSAAALERAIELNAVAVEQNKRAFLWGRRAAAHRARVEAITAEASPATSAGALPSSLDALIERRVDYLTRYQDAAYAERYRGRVEQVRSAERLVSPGQRGLAEAVARYYFKLLAYKDEYEVARLHTDGDLLTCIAARFEGDYRLRFHLAPPVLFGRDPATGAPRKRSFGPWVLKVLGALAQLKRLRGTPFDPFAYSAERRLERRLIVEYEHDLDELLAGLTPANHGVAVALAELPERIRGFGHVKCRHVEQTRHRRNELLAAFRRAENGSAAA